MTTKITTSQFVLSPKECGAYLGLSENTIRRLCKEGKIKAAKSGKNYKIPRPCAEAYIMELAERGGKVEVEGKFIDED